MVISRKNCARRTSRGLRSDNLRSNVIEEISSEMNGTCVRSDNEYHQRRYVDGRMQEQKGKSFAEIIAGTTEKDLGNQLDGLTGDGYIVEQGNGICLCAIWIL